MEHAAAETETNAKSPGAFRTIREVSESLDVPQHVLRFWETRFPQVKPLKRGGGRRYYRPEDVALLHRIRALLYADGYTIRGVQKLLREKGAKGILSMEPAAPASASDARPPIEIDDAGRERFESLMKELLTLRDMLRGRVPPG